MRHAVDDVKTVFDCENLRRVDVTTWQCDTTGITLLFNATAMALVEWHTIATAGKMLASDGVALGLWIERIGDPSTSARARWFVDNIIY